MKVLLNFNFLEKSDAKPWLIYEWRLHWCKWYKKPGFSNFSDSSKRKPSSKSDGSDFDKDAPSPRTSDSSDQDLEDVGSPQNTSSVPLSESPEAARSAASSHPGNPVAPVGEEEEEEGVTEQVGNHSLNARAG